MLLLRLILVLTLAFCTACEQTPQTPKTPRQNYPAIIPDSVDRRAKAEREWRRLLDAYGVPQTPPDLNPITYTPRSLLGANGRIRLFEVAGDAVVARVAAKGFIDRWRDLLGVDPDTASLAASDDAGDTIRLTYRQASYPHPIAGEFGELTLIVSRDGRLMNLDDRFIPVVEIPLRPVIERDDAVKKLVGRRFEYSDLAGRTQRSEPMASQDVTVKRLVFLPRQMDTNVTVNLAWELSAGRSLKWTVYVDAVTGEELKTVQEFKT